MALVPKRLKSFWTRLLRNDRNERVEPHDSNAGSSEEHPPQIPNLTTVEDQSYTNTLYTHQAMSRGGKLAPEVNRYVIRPQGARVTWLVTPAQQAYLNHTLANTYTERCS